MSPRCDVPGAGGVALAGVFLGGCQSASDEYEAVAAPVRSGSRHLRPAAQLLG